PPSAPPAAPSGDLVAATVQRWVTDIKPKLKGLARAMYSSTTVLGDRNGNFALGVANEVQRAKAEDHRKDVEAAIASVVGGKVTVQLVIHSGPDDDHEMMVDAAESAASAAPAPSAGGQGNVVPMQRPAAPPVPTPDEEIDLDDLVDAPPEAVVSPIDRLAQAFPGSKLVDE
ncbi:MAG: hypothetical protein ABMA25_12625, partial [Ilumatobacteraceae bacterium]